MDVNPVKVCAGVSVDDAVARAAPAPHASRCGAEGAPGAPGARDTLCIRRFSLPRPPHTVHHTPHTTDCRRHAAHSTHATRPGFLGVRPAVRSYVAVSRSRPCPSPTPSRVCTPSVPGTPAAPPAPAQGKRLTNIRAAGNDEAVRLPPPRVFSLEDAVVYVAPDELVEVRVGPTHGTAHSPARARPPSCGRRSRRCPALRSLRLQLFPFPAAASPPLRAQVTPLIVRLRKRILDPNLREQFTRAYARSMIEMEQGK
jgi:hypothetical protein